MNDVFVQYGCGLCAPEGWLNFDASPTLRLQRMPLIKSLFRLEKSVQFPKNARYGDIVKGLPLPADSCDVIYCSHVLEHLSLNDFRIALANTYSQLKPGGVFRLVLPDFELIAHTYLGSQAPDAVLRFMEASLLGLEDRPKGVRGLLRAWLGNSAHLWMWDYKGLAKELSSAHFRQIRRAEFGDSKLACFQAVEDVGRWKDCLGIECTK